MNPERLTRQAIRLAQRESKKRGHMLTREQILRLTVQTAEPWKRAFLIGAGLAVGGFAWFCQVAGAPWWIWTLFGLAGVILAVVGFVGKKDYLDRELQKMNKEAPTRIADAVLNALL